MKIVNVEELRDKCFIVIMGSVNVLAEEYKKTTHNNTSNTQLIT